MRLFAVCSYLSRQHRAPRARKWRSRIALGSAILFIYLFYCSSQWFVLSNVQVTKRADSTNRILTPVNGSKMLLLNAYYEHRAWNSSVRFITIAWRSEKVDYNCIFSCNKGLVSSPAKLTAHKTHFWFPYVTADLLCEIPPGCSRRRAALTPVGASMVNLTFLQVHNLQYRQSNFPVEFTVCHSTMFNKYNNVLQFVQAMEMYQILGAKRVVLYKTSCSPDMEEVLRYYSDIGLLEIVPWHIDKYIKVSSSWISSESPGDLHYNGQIPALNDCIYRNMYRTKYLFMQDPDEIIVPLKNVTWHEMFSTLDEKYGSDVSYYFENNVFPTQEFEESGKFNLSQWAGIPGFNFLQHVLREPIPKRHFTTGKLVVNPRRIFEIGVHTIKRQSHRTVEVPYDLGRLFHIRRRKNTNLKKKDLVMDKTLWRYAPEMIRSVTDALSKMDLPSQRQKPTLRF
ncbi:hypothetical protein COCON_G00192330 [Conger conger]|uniref:Glycosyltransferase family 92 protein n=1 Tax=Conger conger TaxID=82655 RepID=A0A9Q1D3S6_CONCO|nr:hypothetical protein COCON_G00192330 [Conger conger]